MFKLSDLTAAQRDSFEICGAFIISIFCNTLYDYAKNLHTTNGGTISFTDCYISVCNNYMKNLQKPEHMKVMIKNLSAQYEEFGPAGAIISYSDWIGNFIKPYIPSDFFSSLSAQNQDHLIHKIVLDLFTEFHAYILTPANLVRIIDNYKDPTNPTVFQNYMVSTQLLEMEKIYTIFLQKGNKSAGKVDIGIVEKLKTALEGEMVKTNQLRTTLQKALDRIKTLEADASKAQDIMHQLQTANTNLRNIATRQATEIQQLKISAITQTQTQTKTQPQPQSQPKTQPKKPIQESQVPERVANLQLQSISTDLDDIDSENEDIPGLVEAPVESGSGNDNVIENQDESEDDEEFDLQKSKQRALKKMQERSTIKTEDLVSF